MGGRIDLFNSPSGEDDAHSSGSPPARAASSVFAPFHSVGMAICSRQGRSSHETTSCFAMPCRGLRRADWLQ